MHDELPKWHHVRDLASFVGFFVIVEMSEISSAISLLGAGENPNTSLIGWRSSLILNFT
jgi:hypothetical protein